MKTSLYFFFFVMSLAGCGEEDPAPSPLIGTWQSYATSVTQCNDPSKNTAEGVCPQCSRFTFTQDTFTLNERGNDYSGTYTIEGKILSLPSMANTPYPELTEQIFEINNGKLVLSWPYNTTNRAGCLRHMHYNKVE